MITKAIFLDRDGVINKEVSYLYKIENFTFIEGVFESLKAFIESGYLIIIVTNQSGISRKLFTLDDYKKITSWMLEKFKQENISIDAIYFCPHGPEENCNCRKPKPGLFDQAKKDLNINMNLSWAIGDSERDIVAAKKAGIVNTILVRSGHKINEKNTSAKYVINSIANANEIIHQPNKN